MHDSCAILLVHPVVTILAVLIVAGRDYYSPVGYESSRLCPKHHITRRLLKFVFHEDWQVLYTRLTALRRLHHKFVTLVDRAW